MANEPSLPIPISYVGSKYLLFDVESAMWLRKLHHVCGLTTGTLPQGPAQNIFLGMPVHLMPEEAQLLVEKGVCYVVDDVEAHERVLAEAADQSHASNKATAGRQSAYLKSLLDQGTEITKARDEAREKVSRQKRLSAKAKANAKPKVISEDDLTAEPNAGEPGNAEEIGDEDAEEFLFDIPSTSTKRDVSARATKLLPHGIIPTTSDLWLPKDPPSISGRHNRDDISASSSRSSRSSTDTATDDDPALVPSEPNDVSSPPPPSLSLLPQVSRTNYPLYRHLNSKGYYMTPGLRFGCQYSTYPGDPLRFHSHFLAVAKSVDEPIDLMALVSGGRLGTGVKKGFLIGGLVPEDGSKVEAGDGDGDQSTRQTENEGELVLENGTVRTFSLEWAYM